MDNFTEINSNKFQGSSSQSGFGDVIEEKKPSIFDELINEEKNRIPIIRDPAFFDERYLPVGIHFRKEQQKQMARVMHMARYGKSILKVDGDYGTGKTLVAQAVLLDFARRAEYKDIPAHYINAGEFDTKYKILSKLHQQYSGRKSTTRGCSDSYFIEKIDQKLAGCCGAILIIDEVDKVLEKDGDSLLYILLERAKLSLILISNYPRWEDKVSGKVYSRIRRGVRERFPQYDLYELGKILEQRATFGLNEGTYNLSLLEYIADQVHREGDARSLIELLKVSAEIAEKHKAFGISKEHVNEAKIRLNRNLIEDNIREQSIHKRVILYSIAKRQDTQNPPSSDELYKTYCKTIEKYIDNHREEDVMLLAKPSIYRLLNELLEQGVIEKEKGFYAKGVGRKPYIYKSFFTARELIAIWGTLNE